MFTDTHAHLYYPEILDSLNEILERAKDSGIERIIVPAVDLGSSRKILELSEKYDMIYAALGVHPCDVSKNEISTLDEIEILLDHEKVVAVGETGLDYYWDRSNIELQKEFFTRQIKMACDHSLPVVIHTRSSTEDAVSIIETTAADNPALKGQFHCFSGNADELGRILKLENFYISYCGNITYKNFDNSETVKNTPAERLLSETDSPFLPPVPFRGKKNEPSYMLKTLEKISEIKSADFKKLSETISGNISKLFF
ncbi:MAG: TatD family hydrolase [Bacteroidetes bacterium]|nr:TatD family hydrolase [Bacteroidota bacterium]